MEVDIELYFWLVDLGVMKSIENLRSKFNEITVNLPRKVYLELHNGVLVSKIIFSLKEEMVSSCLNLRQGYPKSQSRLILSFDFSKTNQQS